MLLFLVSDGELEAEWLNAAGFPQLTRAFEEVSTETLELVWNRNYSIWYLINEQRNRSITYIAIHSYKQIIVRLMSNWCKPIKYYVKIGSPNTLFPAHFIHFRDKHNKQKNSASNQVIMKFKYNFKCLTMVIKGFSLFIHSWANYTNLIYLKN